jgi:hypothetical protein
VKKDLWQLIRNNELLRNCEIPQFQMTLTFTKSSLFYRKMLLKSKSPEKESSMTEGDREGGPLKES